MNVNISNIHLYIHISSTDRERERSILIITFWLGVGGVESHPESCGQLKVPVGHGEVGEGSL